jgi:hypothetical protein
MSTSKKAGKASGIKRAKLAERRRSSVLAAFLRLKKAHQTQPYSDESLDALEEELRSGARHGKFFIECYYVRNASEIIQKRTPSRDTIIKDLKALGVRSNRHKKRSG